MSIFNFRKLILKTATHHRHGGTEKIFVQSRSGKRYTNRDLRGFQTAEVFDYGAISGNVFT